MTLAANLAALARRVVGISADNLVALDAAGNLPAVPGHQLTGLVLTKDSDWLPEILPVTGGTFSVNHGLGEVPKIVGMKLVNKIAEGGWSVGDELLTASHYSYVGATSGIMVARNNTTLIGVFGSNYILEMLNKTTGAGFYMTPANWRLQLRAFA